MNRNSKSVEWYTPPEIISSLGSFDLDPCSPANPPYKIANKIYTKEDNGLVLPWFGRVWLNPPYGSQMKYWVKKMSEHNRGLALLFVRTETEAFQRWIFPVCCSILFIQGRVNFLNAGGIRSISDGRAASVLISYGPEEVEAIEASRIKGKHVLVNAVPFIVVGVSSSWKEIVRVSLGWLNGKGSLREIYEQVERMAPDKVRNNQHFEAKVRQVLQTHFNRIGKGIYSRN